jgi:type IV secretion system protein VirB2
VKETFSLLDPAGAQPLRSALNWIQDVALGSVGTLIGVIAVAAIGLALMTGRVDLRRGISVVLGCFLIFGARGIAEALANLSVGSYPSAEGREAGQLFRMKSERR